MGSFLLLVQNLAPGLYVLLVGIGLFYGLRPVLMARGDLAMARFNLEREQAQELAGRGLTTLFVCIELFILVWVLVNVTTPEWVDFVGSEPEQVGPDRFATDIPFQSGSDLQVPTAPPDGPIIQRTQPPSATPAGTVLPADDPEGCIRQQAFIDIPDSGQIIYETEPIVGTANIENFGSYRFEIRDLAEDAFRVIGGASSDYLEPVVDGPLGNIIPQNFIPGEYRFRMVVFDAASELRAWCEITIFIQESLATPSPSPTVNQ